MIRWKWLPADRCHGADRCDHVQDHDASRRPADQGPHVLGAVCSSNAHQMRGFWDAWIEENGSRFKEHRVSSSQHEETKRRGTLHEWIAFLQLAFERDISRQRCRALKHDMHSLRKGGWENWQRNSNVGTEEGGKLKGTNKGLDEKLTKQESWVNDKGKGTSDYWYVQVTLA